MLAIAVAAAEGKQTQQSTESAERDKIERMRSAEGGGACDNNKTIDYNDDVHVFYCVYCIAG